MGVSRTVLLLGGTGRTGGRVLAQLLERGVAVRAIVRAAGRLPAEVRGHPRLAVVEAELLALVPEDLRRHLEGCDAVISCLGHTISARGIFGPPFSLVTRALSNVVDAVRKMAPARPVHVILMSTVAAHRAGAKEAAHGAGQRLALWVLRQLVPPARDNQRAADLLAREVGGGDPHVEWVAVRPDTLREGGVTAYALHESLVSSIFQPGETNMANVAHFMCELACDPTAWTRWKGRMPVIVNADAEAAAAG
ncbi:MAG: NAD(P)H-binding protein [Vicinamibacterales bacterium]